MSSAAADRGVGHGWRWVVLGVCALLFSCSQFYRVANAVVAPDLVRDLRLSPEALGGVSAAFFYAFAAAQLPLALVLDRAGARTTMAVLTLTGAVGAIVFARSSGADGATLGRVLLGLGMAGNLMGSLKLVGEWFSAREFATLAGVLATLGTVGNIFASTPLSLFVGAVGWRQGFFLIGIATAVLAAACFTLIRDRREAPSSTAASPQPTLAMATRELVRSRDYWLISLGSFCRYGTLLAIQGLWAGPYLLAVASVSPTAAANFILLLNVCAAIGAPIGGWLSDRVLRSRKQVMLVALGGTAAAELALALAPVGGNRWLFGIVLAGFGLTSAFGQVSYAHIKELMPARMAGMAMSGVNIFVMLGAATFLHGFGFILDWWTRGGGDPHGPGGYRAAFIGGSLATALALVAYLFTRDPDLAGHDARAQTSDGPAPRR